MANPEPTHFHQILKCNIHLHYVSHSNQEMKTKDHSLQNPFPIHILSPQITFHLSNLLSIGVPALLPHTAQCSRGSPSPANAQHLSKAGSTLPVLNLQQQLWALLLLHYQWLTVAWGVVEYAAIQKHFLIHAQASLHTHRYNAIEASHLHVSDSPCSC